MAYRNLFLLKHPRPLAAPTGSWTRELDGTTLTRELRFDPVADRMQVAVVRKRPGNPEPWDFSIGRAVTCDVVLRYPFVSKLHAHLSVAASGKISIVDHGSSNRTWRNGKPLQGKRIEDLAIGDTLSFGSLDLELCDAERLHRLLATLSGASVRPA